MYVFLRETVSCACHISKNLLILHSPGISFFIRRICFLINLCLPFKFCCKKCGINQNKIFCFAVRFHTSLPTFLSCNFSFCFTLTSGSCFSSPLKHIIYPLPTWMKLPLNEFSDHILNRNRQGIHNFNIFINIYYIYMKWGKTWYDKLCHIKAKKTFSLFLTLVKLFNWLVRKVHNILLSIFFLPISVGLWNV